MPHPASLVDLLSAVLSEADWSGWLRAWARVSPVLVLVPALGGAALPAATRAGLGAALAIAIAPALHPLTPIVTPLPLALLREALVGAPVALGASLLVYTALMVGGAADDLRGGRESAALPMFEAQHTPLGALIAILVMIGFLESGGAARLVAALVADPPALLSLSSIAAQLTASVSLAVAIAAPIAGSAIVVSVIEALVARAASPAHVSALLAPLRAIVLLAVFALALDRMVATLLLFGAR